MASTGKEYGLKVVASLDRATTKKNIDSALTQIESQVKNMSIEFDVKTANLKKFSESGKDMKMTFQDASGAVATLTKKIDSGFSDAFVKVDRTTKGIKEQSGAIEKAGYSWSKAWEGATKYFLVTGSIVHAKRAVMDMVGSVISLDDSLVELQKVTDLEGDSLSKFVNKAYEAGTELAKTGQEMVDASTSFAKSGYDSDTSLELGKVASMYTNIADEEMSAGDAADFIIAQLKAFKL